MIKTLEQLQLLKIPEIQRLFIEAIQNIVDRATIKEMVEAIENNDVEALYNASGFTPAVLNPLLDKLEEVYKFTTEITIGKWPEKINGVRPIFNMRNEKVEADLKTYSSNFIKRTTEEVKENIRFALSEGISRGDGPRETALNIVGRMNPLIKKREGGIIGLSTNQTVWVSNARKYLEKLDKTYLEMELRDKRFDTIVQKAINEQKPLSSDDITKLITAYEKKALKYRGDTIARTETIQSINRAERASIAQTIEDGLLRTEQVKKWWDDSLDSRTRLSHIQLGKTYNRDNMIGFDEPFMTITGQQLLFPGDTSLGATGKEIINCRCKAQYKVRFRE